MIDKPLSASGFQSHLARRLAVVGYEWLFVLAIIVIMFLWGPKKLPEFAKSIGLVRKEIENARKLSDPKNLASTLLGPTTSSPETDALIETARKLGISTEGKTGAQISDEIVKAKISA